MKKQQKHRYMALLAGLVIFIGYGGQLAIAADDTQSIKDDGIDYSGPCQFPDYSYCNYSVKYVISCATGGTVTCDPGSYVNWFQAPCELDPSSGFEQCTAAPIL